MMHGKVLRVVGVLVLALALTIGVSTIPQAQQKAYIVCSDIPWNPFEMVTASGGEYFGFDMDTMRSIAITEGYDVTFQAMTFDSIIPAIQAGKCDIGASGFTITTERSQVVDFSKAYYLSNQAVVVKSDSGLNIVTALAGMGPTKTIGAQRGTTGADWVQGLIDKGVPIKLNLYETYPLAILDLINGRIDAVVQDQPASKASVAAYPGQLTIAGLILTNEYFGFPVAKGDPSGLLAKINEGMAKLGLQVIDSAAGAELQISPGTPWDNLTKAYFGPSPDQTEAAWNACKGLILTDKKVADYATCMAQKANQ